MFIDAMTPGGGSLNLPAALRETGVVLPDYAGGGIFNLAVSLARASGAEVPARYAGLRLPDGREATAAWAAADCLVLFVIDGLGDDFLRAHAALAPHLWAERVAALSSVFPSTTATAITTLMTAEPASVHGLLGWFVRDDASDAVVAPLPMRHRGGPLVDDEGLVGRMLRTPPMLGRVQREVRVVTLDYLAQGAYSEHHGAGAPVHAYAELNEMPARVAEAAQAAAGPLLIYAYTPLLDSTAHDFGIDSDESRQVLAQIDACYAEMRRRVPQACVLATADHGFIDAPAERCIDLMQHPQLYAMLDGPLTGERRVAYCHVKPAFSASFGMHFARELGHAFHALRAEDALVAGLFGPLEQARELPAAGDWVLIAREDWTLIDRVPGEKGRQMIGVHGGLSHQEMRVPLVIGAASHR